MKIRLCFLVFVILPKFLFSQELFLTSEAASSEAKNRKIITLNTDFTDNGESYTPYLGLMYGISGNLTFMGKSYYSRNPSEKFWGDVDIGTNWRFMSIDKKQNHFRLSLITHIRIPAEGKQIYQYSISGISPEYFSHLVVTSQYRTDNITPYFGFAATILEKKFAANLQVNYAFTIPKGDYKYGNYFLFGLAGGYLLLPKEYRGYNDLNLNLYFEPKAYYFSKNKIEGYGVIDNSGGWKGEFTTGIQFIIASTSIFELGYTKSVADKNIMIEKDNFFITMKYLFF